MDMPHKKMVYTNTWYHLQMDFLCNNKSLEKKHNFCVTSSCFDVAFSKFREDLFFPLGCMGLEGIFTYLQYLQFNLENKNRQS